VKVVEKTHNIPRLLKPDKKVTGIGQKRNNKIMKMVARVVLTKDVSGTRVAVMGGRDLLFSSCFTSFDVAEDSW
jgi:hypothetical protein